MVPQHREEEIRWMASMDGQEAAHGGYERDGGGWMPGTIFYDDWCDAYDKAAS